VDAEDDVEYSDDVDRMARIMIRLTSDTVSRGGGRGFQPRVSFHGCRTVKPAGQ